MSVGIVVAAYNAERYLAATLQSLVQQSTSWYCVVVDDGSMDRTPEVVERMSALDSRIQLVRQPNNGVGSARNAGVRHLPEGVLQVCFLDSDDLLFPEGLTTLVRTLNDRPDAVAASGWADTIDEYGVPFAPGEHRKTQGTRMTGAGLRTRVLGPQEDTDFASLAVYGTIWPPATALVRRDHFVAVGGFDETIPQREDWDLFLRLARRGPIVFVDEQVAWYRRHRGNVTGDRGASTHWKGVVTVKTLRSSENTPAQRRAVRAAHLRDLGYRSFLEVQRSVLAGRRGNWRELVMRLRLLGILLWQLGHLRPYVPSLRLTGVEARLDHALNDPGSHLTVR